MLLFTCVVLSNNTNNSQVSANSRTIELSQSAVDAQSVLNEFDDATLTREGSTVYFEGYKPIDKNVLTEIDYISETDFEELENCTTKYNFSYNSETNIVTIAATATLADGTVEVDEITGVGFINDKDEIDAVMNIDGEGILLSEMRDAGMIQNCGWFSRLIKAIVVAVVVVAVVAVVAATVVVTAGAAAPALVTAGIGVAGSTAVTAGSAAIGVAAGAIVATTVGQAAVQAGVQAGEALGDAAENVAYSAWTKVKEIASAIAAALAVPSITNKCYYIAYLLNGKLIIDNSVALNYLEAYAVLWSAGLINVSSIPKDIYSKIVNLQMSSSLKEFAKKLLNNGQIKKNSVGIYTYQEQDAANLAYATGAFINSNSQSETHDYRNGSGYYYHFHDVFHVLHIWYGNAC